MPKTYSEAVELLIHIPKDYEYRIDAPKKIYHALGDPQKSYKTIHVGGTNGKGTTCTKIAETLTLSGYKVGLFTSPHIECIRERIQINGLWISESDFLETVNSAFAASDQIGIIPQYFEILCAAAFLYFKKEQVDVAVIEVGLGGRTDATNHLDSMLSVITSIGLDHTELLGSTVESIGREKAGIVKPGSDVVIGKTVQRECVKHAGTIYPANSDDPLDLAKTALKVLSKDFNISKDALNKGLKASPPCRMEMHANESIILDVAHNPPSLDYLFKKLKKRFGKQTKYRVLLALGKSKDIKECLKIISENASHIHLFPTNHPRCIHPQDLLKEAEFLSKDRISSQLSAKEVFSLASQSGEKVLVCGTFYILGEVRKSL